MLRQCDSAAKAVICFAYRCSASSHALAAAISASLQGGEEEATPHGLSDSMISASPHGGERGSASSHALAAAISASLQWGRGSCGSRAQRQHDFSFASWGEEEAAARFLVGGSDGSSRISFGWNRKLASKMLRQCDSAAKAVICFAYRCSASSHALAAAISASLQGGEEEATPHGLSDSMISASPHGGKRKRRLTGEATA